MPCDDSEELVYIFKIYEMFDSRLGVIRLEQWPKGLKLWVKDQYVWQSWEDEEDER